MLVFAWWSDLAEFWSDLFDNPLHSAFALIVCVTAVLISIVLVLRFRPVGVRKLAWRVLLASVGFLRGDFRSVEQRRPKVGFLDRVSYRFCARRFAAFSWHGHTKMSAGCSCLGRLAGHQRMDRVDAPQHR
jgi:hypothetical protein